MSASGLYEEPLPIRGREIPPGAEPMPHTRTTTCYRCGLRAPHRAWRVDGLLILPWWGVLWHRTGDGKQCLPLEHN